jgi:hypothetical protein
MELSKYDDACRALQLCLSVDEAKDISDKWIALRDYAKRSINLELERTAAEIRIRAKRRIGEISKTLVKAPSGRAAVSLPTAGESKTKTLAAAGISKGEQYRCEKLASVPSEDFESYVAKSREGSRIVTSNDLLKRFTNPKAHVSHNSGENEWYTPSVIIDAAREVLGGIALDPASCAEANEVVQADRYYDAETNGLMQPWVGTVWLNPPYSQPLIAQFINKLLAERDNIKAAITLTNNGTETGYGQSLLALCDAVCFPDKRIKFTNGDGESTGSPLQGQMICYFGSDRDRFRQCFQFRGRVLYDAH